MSSENARSLAAEAIASGEPAIARSFRFHRRRGPLCGRGYCFQCECATPAGRVLAGRPPAGAPNARVSRHDPLRLLGRIAEAWPPWFYERRFLRGEVQRRLFLEAIRHASSAARLGSACPARPPIPFEEEEADIVV